MKGSDSLLLIALLSTLNFLFTYRKEILVLKELLINLHSLNAEQTFV
jgi:hypothetical protein